MCAKVLVWPHGHPHLRWLGHHCIHNPAARRPLWSKADISDQYGYLTDYNHHDDYHQELLDHVYVLIFYRRVLLGSLVRRLRLPHGVPD